MNKLSLILSRKSLLTIYKSFVRPNLDYADIIYDKPLNESLKREIEMVQYNADLIREPRVIKYIKGSVWNLWQIEDGLENFFFTK